MKIKLITVAVAAALCAWAPVGSARQPVALPYIFSSGDVVGQATGIDTTAAGLLTVNPDLNINALNDVGGGITSNTNNVASILFVGNSTITGFTGTSAIRFNDITGGANASTVNFNGDVFTTQFHHSGTGTVNFNGHVNNTIVASSYIFGADGFLNIGANKIFNSALTTTAGMDTGTLTLNGGSSMTGAIGAGAAAIKQINVVGGNAEITGAVFAKGFGLESNILTIDGALTASAAGNIATTFASDTVFGKIILSGDSAINAGGITVTTTVTGALTNGTIYRIVTAPSGTNAAVVSVINNTPRYTFSGLPTSIGNVDIQLTGIAPLATLVTTPGASAVAPILDVNAAIGTDLRVIQDAIAVLTTSQAIDNALAQLAPANTNLEAPWVAAQATRLIADTWMSRLDKIQDMCCDTECEPNNKKQNTANTHECKSHEQQSNWWIKGFGSQGMQGDANGLNGYRSDAVGAMLGYDVPVGEATRVGLGAGYVNSTINGKHSDNRTKVDSYHLTAYFNHAPEAFFVQGAVTAGIDKYDGSRYIEFPGISRHAKSDVTGQQYTALITAGKHFGVKGTTITPLVGLQASRLYVNSYKEHGAGDVNLSVDSQDYNFLQSTLGIKAEHIIHSGNATYAPEIHAKWLHDFNSTTMSQDATFIGGGSKFYSQGITQDHDMYNVGAGMTFLSCNCDQNAWSVKGLYDYKWNDSHYDSHQASLIVGLRF